MTYYIHQIPKVLKSTFPWDVRDLTKDTIVIEIAIDDMWDLVHFLIDKVQNRVGYLILPPIIDLKRLFLKLTLNQSEKLDTKVIGQLEKFIKVIEPIYTEDSNLLLQL